MKVEEILNQKVTFCSNSVGYHNQISPTIKQILDTTVSGKYRPQVEIARQILKNGTFEEYADYKKQNIPIWTPSGLFKQGNLKDNAIISYTNLIALDIDVKDTGKKTENLDKDINYIRQDFFNKPYVLAVLTSCSGNGLYALVYVEDGKKTKQYIRYFGDLLKQKYDIDLDTQACNLSRKRIFSWEEDLYKWVKPMDYNIIPWKLYKDDEMEKLLNPYQPNTVLLQPTLFDADEDFLIERTREAIWALLNSGFNADKRGYWYYCGCDFANFLDGKQMWDKLCSNYPLKQRDDPNKIWKNCEENKTLIDDDFHRKWQGMAKNQLGSEWWKKNN